MVILGINDGHNASAALLVDGVLLSAVAEERLTRRKLEMGYPARAIRQCLEIAGLSASDVDRVAVSSKGLPPRYFMVKRDTSFSVADFMREQHEYWRPKLYEGKTPAYLEVFSDKRGERPEALDWSLVRDEDDMAGLQRARLKLICADLDIAASSVQFFDHHGCHAYYSVFALPDRLSPVLVFTADGMGDGANGSIWVSRPGQPLERLIHTETCNIGRIYRYITLLLGMKPGEHEHKVMGLAPYAHPEHSRQAYDVFAETLQVVGLDFTYRTRPRDHFFHFRDKLEGIRFDSIAWGLQKWTEDLLAQWVRNGVASTGIRRIAFSGGVAQNVKANQRIAECDEVEWLFVPPAPHDESLSIGAAFWAFCESADSPDAILSSGFSDDAPYLGRGYDDHYIERCLARCKELNGMRVQKLDNGTLVDLLEQGHVVGRFAGRMEFGARALGNRSIIADPRRRDVIPFINDAIKQRDFWMPFAPSVIEERADRYIVNPKKLDGRYMTMTYATTPQGRRDLAAGVHGYDHTARAQIVTRKANPAYHELIVDFERRTGVGALLNTSFNLHGEPIVESPEDAISTFLRSQLRHVALGNTLISKPDAP